MIRLLPLQRFMLLLAMAVEMRRMRMRLAAALDALLI